MNAHAYTTVGVITAVLAGACALTWLGLVMFAPFSPWLGVTRHGAVALGIVSVGALGWAIVLTSNKPGG